ncbi:MAG: hypothetical protein KAZ87_13395 [Spirochaetes bacterium]|nr:hypothetical protein [Spirochaetota bacterium]
MEELFQGAVIEGMNYSVSELGGFAGQTLAELTGREDVGREKINEEKRKAQEAAEKAEEAAKRNGETSQAGEGFINALGAGLIRIKNDLAGLWNSLKGIGESLGNLVTGKGFNTQAELDQMEMNKQIAIAAAMGEYNKSKSKDMADQIVADFWKDSKEVTEAKRQVMKDAGLDTTELDQKLVSMRQLDAELKAQAKAELLAQQSAGKDTQTQYIAQFGAVYSNMLGDQSPKSASFLDNLLGNLHAEEGLGNYVKYVVNGDHVEYQGKQKNVTTGYDQVLRPESGETTSGLSPFSITTVGISTTVSTLDAYVGYGLGTGNILSSKTGIGLRFYGETVTGRVFNGNQYWGVVTDTKTIGTACKFASGLTTAVSIGSDLYQYKKGNIDGKRLEFNTYMNIGLAGMMFIPGLDVLAIPAGVAWGLYGDEIYDGFMTYSMGSGRYENYKKYGIPRTNYELDLSEKLYNTYYKPYVTTYLRNQKPQREVDARIDKFNFKRNNK